MSTAAHDPSGPIADCELCHSPGGELLWQDAFCRIVSVEDPDHPGFCRVILNAHVREMSDLPPGARARLMKAVFATETALRETTRAAKINLASLGNVVPHLHWHVIARHRDDAHFPRPIWARRVRPTRSRREAPEWNRIAARLKDLLG